MNKEDLDDYEGQITKRNRRKKQEVKPHQVVAEHSRGLKGVWQMIVERSQALKNRKRNKHV